MTKAELVERIAVKNNLTKKDTERVVNIVFGSVIQSLAGSDKVELRGFGSFRVRSRESRDGRNPRTGDKVAIPPKKVPFFKAGKELRELVDGTPPEGGPAVSSSDGTRSAVPRAVSGGSEEKSF
ncbi:MAG: integration host factor subunit beta [Candidatus Tectomicrobia bacterium]|uniref:Integration host factor subunit beta n=1 Tax=Tectimicrobiota bacterium TaxID=2528274 RepID=A0A932ZU48_UNCTE|nr:integration host factor subunit beta [Candidatus Tectomicrobia bacterium]